MSRWREYVGTLLGTALLLAFVLAGAAAVDWVATDDEPASPATVTATATVRTTATATATVTVQARAARAADRLDTDLARLAWCESRGQADAVSPSGKYTGLYQFDRATWAAVWTRAGRPDLAAISPEHASPATQTQAARLLHADRDFSPWPACSRLLGLTGGTK